MSDIATIQTMDELVTTDGDICDKHVWLIQNSVTNSIPKTVVENNDKPDPITGDLILKRGGFTLNINQYSTLPVQELKASFHRMFDIMLIKFSMNFYSPSKTIEIRLRDYMSICNLSNVKKSRQQLNTDLEILFRCVVSYLMPNKKGHKNTYSEMRLCQDWSIKNSVLHITLGDQFFKMLTQKNIPRMIIPLFVFQCSLKDNPNSYYLGRKIFEYYRVNLNKKRKNIISIKSLLEYCPKLKDYNKEKYKTRRIQEPFERDMDHLNEQIQWNYCKAKGVMFTKEELKNWTFKDFLNAYIEFFLDPSYVDLMKTSVKSIPKQKKKSYYKK